MINHQIENANSKPELTVSSVNSLYAISIDDLKDINIKLKIESHNEYEAFNSIDLKLFFNKHLSIIFKCEIFDLYKKDLAKKDLLFKSIKHYKTHVDVQMFVILEDNINIVKNNVKMVEKLNKTYLQENVSHKSLYIINEVINSLKHIDVITNFYKNRNMKIIEHINQIESLVKNTRK